MKKIFLIMAILFMSLYGVINYYIGSRAWQYIGREIPFLNNTIYWIIFSLIAAAYIISILIGSIVPKVVSNIFNIVGSYWMAIMFYLILILPVIDLMRILSKKFAFISDDVVATANVQLIVTGVVISFLFALMVYGAWNGHSAKVTKYDLDINKIEGNIESLKIIMISDIHLGGIVDNRRLTNMVNRINDLTPDLVLIPGDIIDSKLEHFIKQNMSDTFKRLKSKYGTYACLGNHDTMGDKVDVVVENFENAGIKVLRDEVISIEDSFYIIGRDDPYLQGATKVKRKDLSYLTKDLDRSKTFILMDHQPKNLSDTEKEGIDLQVSGHTHKGQLFPESFITNKIYELDYGYLKKNNSKIIVSSGYGTWGPPIRLGSRSEIVEINLKFKG
ncbi:metallophosphoesterase [Clostridium vincentii]|uniref:Putative metallophosphoesterase n=1 Tax=Clostridium vincentii TaxID=52704 RepID=A0A2T0BIZ5_9CLOT|nr:metallophosphoesterase [Clostridium vincentii]PRR83813.1 putative metallophosphoesterase [Clostridium vincentii]